MFKKSKKKTILKLFHTVTPNQVQLLTITSPDGMCNEREHQLKDLFPDGPTSLPRRFRGKKVDKLTHFTQFHKSI